MIDDGFAVDRQAHTVIGGGVEGVGAGGRSAKLPGQSDGECVSANGRIGRAVAPVEINFGIVTNDSQSREIHVVVVLAAQTISDGGSAGVDAKPVDISLAAGVGSGIEDK